MEKKMKKVLCLLLVFTLAFTLPAANSVSAAAKKTTKKVKLSKKKLTLYVGGTKTLKVKNTKKKVKWSSSKKKVATVSKKGKVKAKKKGKTTITAKVGKKKLKCKVTVKDKPIPPVTLSSVSVLNSYTVQVTLSAAQALAVSNFTIQMKTYEKGTFNRTARIESISTSDNRTYKISLGSDSAINDGVYVQVTVKGLTGTGTASKTVCYVSGSYQYTDTKIYTATRYASISEWLYLDGFGYSTISTSGLPAGISAKLERNSYYGDEVKFYGAPTQTGTFQSKLVAKDELGNSYTYDVIWLIGSASKIEAFSAPYYGVLYENGNYLSQNIRVTGGSGSYSYEIQGNDYGLEIYEGTYSTYISGRLYEAGNYNISIKVTDANNASLTTTYVFKVSILQGITITGTIKDLKGNAIKDYNSDIIFENKDKGNRYLQGCYAYTNSNGEYKANVVPGTYNVNVTNFNTMSETSTVNLTTARTLDLKLPVYTITVKSNNSDIPLSSSAEWKSDNAEDDAYGTGDKVYLKPGTYRLHASWKTGLSNVAAQLNITVTANTTSATASVTASTMVAGTIVAEQPVAVSLNGTTKAYTFVPKQSGTYYFWSDESDGLDVRGYLYSSTGISYTSNDNDGPGRNFYITRELTTGTTYYIAVAPTTDGVVGNVTLHVSAIKPDTASWD